MSGSEDDLIAEAKGDKGRGWRFYLAVAAAILALIFVVQNTEETNVTFLFAEANLPLFFALVIAIALGALIGWATPRVRRSPERSTKDR